MPRPRVRLTRRDIRGPAVANGPLEVTAVARVVGIGLHGRSGATEVVLARPGRIEVRRGGVLQRRVSVPDWGLRVRVGAVVVVALAVLWRTRLGRAA